MTDSVLDNISISPIKVGDEEEFWNLIQENHDHLLDYFPITLGLVTDLASAKKFITSKVDYAETRHSFYFIICLHKKMIGVLSVKSINWSVPKCEIAYFVSKEFGGKGIATAGIKWLVEFCFEELKVQKIFAKINPGNEASKKAVAKNGFTLEAILKKDYRNGNGVLTDSLYYSLMKDV